MAVCSLMFTILCAVMDNYSWCNRQCHDRFVGFGRKDGLVIYPIAYDPRSRNPIIIIRNRNDPSDAMATDGHRLWMLDVDLANGRYVVILASYIVPKPARIEFRGALESIECPENSDT